MARFPRSLLRVVPCGLLAGTVTATAALLAAVRIDPSRYMSVAELRPGMKGYGLTVFSGTKPERFGVEILAVLRNFRPSQDLIVVRTEHPRLDVAKTVGGMSGSPVYVGDRLIGAYAYGWFFGSEPIAGVTPIHAMLDDLRRPLPPALAPGPAGPVPAPGRQGAVRPPRPGHRFAGDPLHYDLREHARQVAALTAPALAPPQAAGLAPASTPVMVGGLGPRAMAFASELLGPVGLELVQAGGSGTAKPSGAPARFVDGGVLTVQLVRGDMSAAALGTATHVIGDRVLGFGHPLLNGGIEELPTAVGAVHWIVATQSRSFKMGEPTEPVGALVSDRQASIVVDTTRTAPVIPLSLVIDGVPGAAHPRWQLEVAHDQFLAPNFIAIALGSALETTASERNDYTWRAHSRLALARYGVIELDDYGTGAGNPIGPDQVASTQLVRALGALLSNPWEPVRVERIDSEVRFELGRETLTLRGSQVLEPEIDAGESARIALSLETYRGARQRTVIEVPMDLTLAGKTVEIHLEPGYRVERVIAAPESLGDLVRNLPRQYFPAESVVASYKLGENGASFRNRVATRLPPGAADTLQSTSQSVAPALFTAQRQLAFPVRGFVVGKDTVRVKIREVLR
ncbi:MAG: hypothetical protein HY744_10980 [Deltaproteobacteria bacterium]|nr:hypothetical protein [Deltaproteobacteria bacterium]